MKACRVLALCALALLLTACGGSATPSSREEAPRPEWALAIHAGAGSYDREEMGEEAIEEIRAHLAEVLTVGQVMLDEGADALDVVEALVRMMEDDPLFNAGKGAVFTHDGRNTLDAAIMDGRDLGCGAVANVTRVKNPVTLARRVMSDSRHVLLAGEGAEAFAEELGLEMVDPEYFYTERRWKDLQEKIASDKGTVGAVALDVSGNLAAATSTGGMTNKKYGRIGDVPIIGAGTYASNDACAISCTGHGEEFIRRNVAHEISALVRYEDLPLDEAVRIVLEEQLPDGAGGVIAVSPRGELSLRFTSGGMARGAADERGRFEVSIF